MSDKWILNYGCHRGTLTSRDTATEEHNSREEAYNSYLEHKKFLNSIGYQIWYADIIAPNGEKNRLEQNPYY